MHQGVEVGIYLRPGLEDDNFVAKALGNLAAFRLQTERKEHLDWQVLRVQGSGGHHHYRLVVRHPERALDLGFGAALEAILKDLSNESVEQLHERLDTAERSGLSPVPLRPVHEEVDYWRDDFWKWLG